MAKVKYDVSKAQPQQFSVPKPDVYEAVIKEASHGDSSSGNPMFTIVFQITKGDHKESRIWYYILTDGSQDWRLREFFDAQGIKPKGEVEPSEMVGNVVQIRTAIDPAKDGYDEKARIKNVLPAGEGASAGGEDDEPYTEWSLEDLKEEAEARELEIEGRKTKPKLVKALEADDEAEAAEAEEGGEEEEEEGDDEGEEELTRADLDEMSRNDLKGLIKEEELDVKVMKKDSDDDLREKIAEALELGEDEEEEEGEGEGEEEEEEDADYDEWEISELKAELKERGLKVDGRKSVLAGRLKKDDESGKEPF